MFRASIVSALVLLGITVVASAQEAVSIPALRQEMMKLIARKEAAIKRVHSIFDGVIRGDGRNEKELEAERAALRAQEKEMLAAVTDPVQRTAIEERYNRLRRMLSQQISLDAKQIVVLRKEEGQHVRRVQQFYNPKINTLQAEIWKLERKNINLEVVRREAAAQAIQKNAAAQNAQKSPKAAAPPKGAKQPPAKKNPAQPTK
jgi:hypothetical protein